MIIKSFKNVNKIDKEIKINLGNNDFINLVNLVTRLYRPLNGFCNSEDVNNILIHKRISKKNNWTIPIILSIKSKTKINFKKFYKLQYKNKIVGLIKPNDLFQINKKEYCKKIFSTFSNKHPYVKIISNLNNLFIGGKVFLLKKFLPKDKIFPKYKSEVKNIKNSVVFSTRNICHLGHQRIHEYIIKKNKRLVIAIIINDKNKFNPDLIVKSYMHLKKKQSLYKNIKIIKISLPSFFGGPNEAYLQATCFNNLGFKGFVVGRDHAGYKKFFKKYASQKIFNDLNDLKIKIFKTKEPYFCSRCLKVGFRLVDICGCKNTRNYLSLDGKTVKKLLDKKRFKNLEKFLNPYIFSFLKKKYKKIRN